MIQQDRDLDANAIAYCDRIWNIVRRVRGERKIRRKDFPPIAVCCSDGIDEAESYTHGPSGCVYHPLIKNALNTNLGPIGGRTRYEPTFRIGRCAEPNAANKLVKKSRGRINNLNVIRFSTPFRPFTKEERIYCENCEHTF